MSDFITLIKQNKNGAADNKVHRFSEREQGVSFSTGGLSKNKTSLWLRDTDPVIYKVAMDLLTEEKFDLET